MHPKRKNEVRWRLEIRLERLEVILLKWSKSEKERQLPYDSMYLESKIWHRRAETDLLTRE